MKKILVFLLLVCTLTLCLASCSVSKKDIVGTWRSEWDYNGSNFVGLIEINDDGTYESKTYKFINYGLDYTLSSSKSGEYKIKGKVIYLYQTETKWTEYNYIDGQLENGGLYYTLWEES